MNNIFDTHAHYDDNAFDGDRDILLSEIHRGGVKYIINCGCDVKSSEEAIRLCEKYDFIYAAVGIHPEEIDKDGDNALDTIEALAQHEKVVAIGEIGLDYYWDSSQKEKQKEIFKKQIEIAKGLSLPVIVHDREAHGDVLEILKQTKPKGVLHCFSGSPETALQVLDIGMYLGFGGAITFKNAKKPVEVLKAVPNDRFLLETDCPYMTPVPHRGKRNNSLMIEFTAKKIAEIKAIEPQKVIDIATENAKTLFFGK